MSSFWRPGSAAGLDTSATSLRGYGGGSSTATDGGGGGGGAGGTGESCEPVLVNVNVKSSSSSSSSSSSGHTRGSKYNTAIESTSQRNASKASNTNNANVTGTLPMHRYAPRVLHELEQHRVLIITGETGCGKSTVVPQQLLAGGWAGGNAQSAQTRCIACTQPRRMAVLSVSQ